MIIILIHIPNFWSLFNLVRHSSFSHDSEKGNFQREGCLFPVKTCGGWGPQVLWSALSRSSTPHWKLAASSNNNDILQWVAPHRHSSARNNGIQKSHRTGLSVPLTIHVAWCSVRIWPQRNNVPHHRLSSFNLIGKWPNLTSLYVLYIPLRWRFVVEGWL